MGDIIKALNYMVGIANDDTHGYDQENRLGPDFDCSSLIAKALHEAGFKVAVDSWTGNIRKQLLENGFEEIPVNHERKAGDIFLTEGRHIVMCKDDKTIVHASINENGTITGGKTGDQTGNEICIANFYTPSYGWQHHFRYKYANGAKNYDANIAGKYAVCGTTWLNVRAEAGVNGKYLIAIPAGTNVECGGFYSTVSGTRWLFVEFTYNNKTHKGFVSSKYLQGLTTANGVTSDKNLSGKYKVTACWLNIRTGAGTNYGVVRAIPYNTVVECDGTYDTFDGTKWLRIKCNYTDGRVYYGYCSTKYLIKDEV